MSQDSNNYEQMVEVTIDKGNAEEAPWWDAASVQMCFVPLIRYIYIGQPALIPNQIEVAVKDMKQELNNLLYADAIKLFQELRREISPQIASSASYVRIVDLFNKLEKALQLNAKLNIVQK